MKTTNTTPATARKSQRRSVYRGPWCPDCGYEFTYAKDGAIVNGLPTICSKCLYEVSPTCTPPG